VTVSSLVFGMVLQPIYGAISDRVGRKWLLIGFGGRVEHFDGEKEAKLVALAYSKPPEGRARWTLLVLDNKVVELGIERASNSTIGRTLKKTVSSRFAGNAG
jgi:hypothetical protein